MANIYASEKLKIVSHENLFKYVASLCLHQTFLCATFWNRIQDLIKIHWVQQIKFLQKINYWKWI